MRQLKTVYADREKKRHRLEEEGPAVRQVGSTDGRTVRPKGWMRNARGISKKEVGVIKQGVIWK